MPIETSVTQISDLNASYPADTDSAALGSNHLRNLKTAAKSLNASGGSAQIGFLQSGAGATARTAQAKLRDVVSAKDFGATGDGTTDDTAALNAFLLAVTRGHIPAGTYKITGPLDFQSNQTITADGAGTLIDYLATPSANAPVLNIASKSNTTVSDLSLRVPVATYTSARSIYISSSTNCHVKRVIFSGGAGGNAGYITGSSRCSISGSYVDDYVDNGFYVNGGYGNTIEDNDIPDGTNGKMGVQLVGGEGNAAKNNRIAKTPDNYFGIHAYGGNFPVVSGNSVKNTRREAIALGGSQIGARVTGNTCYWDANLGTGDFGISVAGDDVSTIVADFLVANNTVMNSAYDGIGIAGWCQRGRVVDNIIRDCARAALATHQSGIKLYGWIASAVVNDVVVSGNTIAKIDSAGLLYAVSESAGLGSVSGNIVANNKTIGLSGDIYTVTADSQVVLNDDDVYLKTSTQTPAAGSGSITSATGTLHYQRVGKFMMCRLTVTITTNGTGATSVIFPLPFTATAGVLSGGEGAVTGKGIKAGPSGGGAQVTITNYDNTYPGADGATLALSGILEIA